MTGRGLGVSIESIVRIVVVCFPTFLRGHADPNVALTRMVCTLLQTGSP